MIGQLKAVCVVALMITTLPVAVRRNPGTLARSKITAYDLLIPEALLGNTVKIVPQAVSLVRTQESARVRTPIGSTFKVIEKAPLVRLRRDYEYKIEVSQNCQFKVTVAQGANCRGLFDVLFSQPPTPQKDQLPPSMQNIWGHVSYEVMEWDRDHSIDPSKWSFNGDVLLTLWIEPRQQWLSPKGHIIFKGRSIPLPFEYVTNRQNRVFAGGKRVTQFVFDYKQEDEISAVQASVTITPIAKNR
jgi:hypothetical protein